MSNNKQSWFWARQRAADELDWARVEELDPILIPRPLVLVTGAFDLIHAAHIRLLKTAREHAGKGSVLVAINSDSSVKERKGPTRPILTWPERAATIWALGLTDIMLEINSEEELDKLTMNLKPDYKVLGQEYIPLCGKYPFMKEIIVRQNPLSISTSYIIDRVKEALSREVST